jgi:PPM family protein phosphatase
VSPQPAPFVLDIASLSDPGTFRTTNEDQLAVVHFDRQGGRHKGTLLLVADGLGGYNGGEIASGMVATEIPKLYAAGTGADPEEDIVRATEVCNRTIHAAACASPELNGMGSTMVAAIVLDPWLIFAHVGDSRGYLFRRGALVHRTEDHSLTGRPASGPQARRRVAHVLTRALGPRPSVNVDVVRLRLEPGDVLVLCSDGLTGSVDDETIVGVVSHQASADAAAALIQLAKNRDGQDNISVVVARVCPLSSP